MTPVHRVWRLVLIHPKRIPLITECNEDYETALHAFTCLILLFGLLEMDVMGYRQLTSYLFSLNVQPPVFVGGSDAFNPMSSRRGFLRSRSPTYSSIFCPGRPSPSHPQVQVLASFRFSSGR